MHCVRSFVWLFAAACSVGAPPGFSSGDHWTFPLVGPLEDGLLVTPVSIRGHGPYLFAIDPDANVTALDQQVAVEAGLLVGSGPKRIDESGTGRTWFYAEVRDLKIAGLTIDRRDAMVFPNGLYDTEGRRLRGILGRDVFADSLVFGFDRDQGIATLSTVKAFQAPPDAVAVKYETVSSRSSNEAGGPGARDEIERHSGRASPGSVGSVMPVPRRLAHAQIDGSAFTVHLDLGAVTSQLPTSGWAKAQLAPAEAKLRLVDEAAQGRDVEQAGTAKEVVLGGAKAAEVAFVPFVDKRWATEGVDGALGLDFFQPFAVYASWDNSTYYLKPRGDAAALTAARLGRWGTEVPTCPNPGCVAVELVASGGAVMLQVARDAQAANRPLEVYLGATAASGKKVAPLVVELPAGTDQLRVPVPPDYAGATLTVLDVSPFPRACIGDKGCLAWVGGPLAGIAELSPEGTAPRAPSEPAARTIALDKLRRATGEQAIAPSDEVQKAAVGKAIAVTIVKVCLSVEGKVESTKITKSSGVPAYDDQLQSTIKATWTFEPTQVDGMPAPVCTTATFMAPARGPGQGHR